MSWGWAVPGRSQEITTLASMDTRWGAQKRNMGTMRRHAQPPSQRDMAMLKLAINEWDMEALNTCEDWWKQLEKLGGGNEHR